MHLQLKQLCKAVCDHFQATSMYSVCSKNPNANPLSSTKFFQREYMVQFSKILVKDQWIEESPTKMVFPPWSLYVLNAHSPLFISPYRYIAFVSLPSVGYVHLLRQFIFLELISEFIFQFLKCGCVILVCHAYSSYTPSIKA